jgi:hypothetical protein
MVAEQASGVMPHKMNEKMKANASSGLSGIIDEGAYRPFDLSAPITRDLQPET